MFYQKMLEERQRIVDKIRENQQIIDTLPAGNLSCARNGKWVKWYQIIDGERIYIPKTDQLRGAQLAYKKYLQAENADFNRQLQAIDAYLKRYEPHRNVEKLLGNEAYQPLLQVFLTPTTDAFRKWAEEPYEQNPYNPERKIHRIHQGLAVRSKSEAMIATRLYTNNIPFRYECALYLNQKKVYPDFTIRHPVTGALYYWEHLGLLEDPTYSERTGRKIELYAKAGLYINRNLLITSEEQSKPLSVDEIDKMIADYFLCA